MAEKLRSHDQKEKKKLHSVGVLWLVSSLSVILENRKSLWTEEGVCAGVQGRGRNVKGTDRSLGISKATARRS